MIDTRKFGLPKPSAQKRRLFPLIVYPDGREVCNEKCAEGKRLYRQRVRIMWERQGRKCRICKKHLALGEATFDHEDGRGQGGGHRDDRTEKDGKWYNSAVCQPCNGVKGSRRGYE